MNLRTSTARAIPADARATLGLAPTRRDVGDADVARALAADEDWAGAEVWHRFAPMVLATAERALGSRSEAEDLAQEVFCQVFRAAKTLREPDRLRSFVYSVAVHALKSQLRYRRARSWLSFESPEALLDPRFVINDVEGREALSAVTALLGRLSARDRLVFLLRRIEAMTVEEIGATLHLSGSTVKRSMSRASSRLSRWVNADPGLQQLLEPSAFTAAKATAP